jgi:uncharacterized protein with PIN domain
MSRSKPSLATAREEDIRRGSLGDCFIYAQAKVGGASLLYKGDDFSKTDIEGAS